MASLHRWVWFSFSFREPALPEELLKNILTGEGEGKWELVINQKENLRCKPFPQSPRERRKTTKRG